MPIQSRSINVLYFIWFGFVNIEKLLFLLDFMKVVQYLPRYQNKTKDMDFVLTIKEIGIKDIRRQDVRLKKERGFLNEWPMFF